MSTSAVGTRESNYVRVRIFFVAGALLTAWIVVLGSIWPGSYTLLAIPMLPSPFLFLVGAFRPSFILARPRLRLYLVCASTAAALATLFDIWWLHRQR